MLEFFATTAEKDIVPALVSQFFLSTLAQHRNHLFDLGVVGPSAATEDCAERNYPDIRQ